MGEVSIYHKIDFPYPHWVENGWEELEVGRHETNQECTRRESTAFYLERVGLRIV